MLIYLTTLLSPSSSHPQPRFNDFGSGSVRVESVETWRYNDHLQSRDILMVFIRIKYDLPPKEHKLSPQIPRIEGG